MVASQEKHRVRRAAENTDASPYLLLVDSFPDDAFRVHAFQGRETLSSYFSFDVSVTVDRAEDVQNQAVGKRVVFWWNIGGERRAVYGLVARVRLVSTHEFDRPEDGDRQYSLRLVPRLWLLKQTRRSRIFQEMTVPEIVTSVCAGAGITTQFRLLREQPIREYCTQYEESDYEFVRRLLAEAGIWFTVSNPPALQSEQLEREVLLLSDAALYDPCVSNVDAHASAAAAPVLHYFPQAERGLTRTDKVTRFEVTTSVKPNAAMFSDYDPEQPMSPLKTRAGQPAPNLEVYDHHSPFHFPNWRFASEEPALMLRQARRRATVACADSGCPVVSPGHRFRLSDHPDSYLDREYAVVRVEHRGVARPTTDSESRLYQNRLELVPADVVYPQARPRRRSVQVTLTATVTGPAHEAVHTDRHGRIKVQFHWDREGNHDARSSCWMRTMQPWAGASFGSQFIPRVGMEVVVTFEGGDPDKPIVLGSTYNATHPAPFMLPEQKTRSGLRTQSVGGGGHNELSFEDAAGREQVYLRAERDLKVEVGQNHTRVVQKDDRVLVHGDQSETVRGTVLRQLGKREENIRGDSTCRIGGRHARTVNGDCDERVRGAFSKRVEGHEHHESNKGSSFLCHADATVAVQGSLTTMIGTHDRPSAYTLRTEGRLRLGSSTATEISDLSFRVTMAGPQYFPR